MLKWHSKVSKDMFSSHQTLCQHKINALRLSKNNEEENLDVQTRSVVPNPKHRTYQSHWHENVNDHYTLYVVSFPQKSNGNLHTARQKQFLKVNWIQDIHYNKFLWQRTALLSGVHLTHWRAPRQGLKKLCFCSWTLSHIQDVRLWSDHQRFLRNKSIHSTTYRRRSNL